MEGKYTPLQGQYLAFIHCYTKIHGCPPAEGDMERHFKVSPPAVHRMVLLLAEKRLIERTPRRARSIRVLLPREQIPNLE